MRARCGDVRLCGRQVVRLEGVLRGGQLARAASASDLTWIIGQASTPSTNRSRPKASSTQGQRRRRPPLLPALRSVRAIRLSVRPYLSAGRIKASAKPPRRNAEAVDTIDDLPVARAVAGAASSASAPDEEREEQARVRHQDRPRHRRCARGEGGHDGHQGLGAVRGRRRRPDIVAARVAGQLKDLVLRARRRRRGRGRGHRLAGRPRHPAPLHRARDGAGGAGPLARRQARHRPADRERLLLRLRRRGAVPSGGPREDRDPDAQDHQGGPAVLPAPGVRPRRDRRAEGRALQDRADRAEGLRPRGGRRRGCQRRGRRRRADHLRQHPP